MHSETCFREKVYATHVVLEAVRKSDVKVMAFMSSSTVYGDAKLILMPEDYPPELISVYGSSKLASESLIMAYAHTYGFRAVIYRLANIVGPRSKHGVIYDFLQKLQRNPSELEILGDGTQRKSYLSARFRLIGYYKSDLKDSSVLSGVASYRKLIDP